ncbi:sugar phosphate isomerase/epimerase [Streptomyces sp. 6-11-2]|uniref:sugar phosphate isomerase/epimerase family protein n=1 Tax=Streptomyces sp. 6-11-2 TaxID=2585753 RepID=UPI001144EF82|nr:sugar phosphate isomerase/epimerase family protein [Streptomyces sp. 6-11-2]
MSTVNASTILRTSPKVGVDGRKLPEGAEPGALGRLRHAAELGLDGVFFRSILEMSETLDPGELREVRALADELGLYLEAGVGKVNPYATPETPEIRILGDGDYLRGMERMIQAAAEIGIHELWTGTANYKFGLPGYFVFDRFRTDAPWPDQLTATVKVLRSLAPVLNETGSHLNLETHEEITSFELVRIVEEVGPDTVGITFDIGNVLVRAEDPVKAAQRVAPYVRMTHVKDAGLYFTDFGIGHQLVPVGQGVIDWEGVFGVLRLEAPHVNLSIENPQLRFEMPLHVYDPTWRAAHPDLTTDELAAIVQMTVVHESRIRDGLAPTREQVYAAPCESEDQLAFITESAAFIRETLAKVAGRGDC